MDFSTNKKTILGIFWKFPKKIIGVWIRIPGVPQQISPAGQKTSARKKGIRAEAESLSGVLIIKLNYSVLI